MISWLEAQVAGRVELISSLCCPARTPGVRKPATCARSILPSALHPLYNVCVLSYEIRGVQNRACAALLDSAL